MQDFLSLARLESERIIAVLSKCHSRSDLVDGFQTVAVGVATGTGNQALIEACNGVISASNTFTDDQLRTLRDDLVANARAFLASTGLST